MRALAWSLAVGVNVALTLLVVQASLPYLDLQTDHAFIVEKGDLGRHPVWRAALYFHVPSAVFALLAGPLLLSQWTLRRSRRLHRIVGTAYCVAVLWWAVPSGLLLALAAKGGPAGQAGFLTLGVLWALTTGLGLRAVRQGRLRAHVAWMTRSYALAHSAITFRILFNALYLLGASDHAAYLGAIHLSLAGSVVLGEWLIRRPALIPTPARPRVPVLQGAV